jgi:hypothetical protein
MKQITDRVMMIRPKHFGFNPQTADDNTFQSDSGDLAADEISHNAILEFDHLVETLRSHGVTVDVLDDTNNPVKPDAVFPNNWISMHEDGVIITYPMYCKLRRSERRDEIVDAISEKYHVSRKYAFEQYEAKDQFLEGTGSMVLDREHKILYACLSGRTDIRMLDKFCVLRGYTKVTFTAISDEVSIYHTNVMMALGEEYVVICMDCIPDDTERQELIESFLQSGKKIVEITEKQMNAYAGNMLQLQTQSGSPILLMSEQAHRSLRTSQIAILEKFNTLVYSNVQTIESYGGGSVRCMLAENFLPRN